METPPVCDEGNDELRSSLSSLKYRGRHVKTSLGERVKSSVCPASSKHRFQNTSQGSQWSCRVASLLRVREQSVLDTGDWDQWAMVQTARVCCASFPASRSSVAGSM